MDPPHLCWDLLPRKRSLPFCAATSHHCTLTPPPPPSPSFKRSQTILTKTPERGQRLHKNQKENANKLQDPRAPHQISKGRYFALKFFWWYRCRRTPNTQKNKKAKSTSSRHQNIAIILDSTTLLHHWLIWAHGGHPTTQSSNNKPLDDFISWQRTLMSKQWRTPNDQYFIHSINPHVSCVYVLLKVYFYSLPL